MWIGVSEANALYEDWTVFLSSRKDSEKKRVKREEKPEMKIHIDTEHFVGYVFRFCTFATFSSNIRELESKREVYVAKWTYFID